MRPRWYVQRAAIVACLGLTFRVTHATSGDSSPTDVSSGASSPRTLEGLESFGVIKRDGHHNHNLHASPLVELNETEILMYHAPTPPSYYTIDWDNTDTSVSRYPGLIFAHAVFMCLAFFIALPVGIAMRSVRHGWHGVAVMLFYGLSVVGCATSALYTKLTPNMYEGSSHGSHGYLVLLFALLLSAIDVLHLIRRLYTFITGDQERSLRTFWSSVVLGKDTNESEQGPECTGLIGDEPEEFDEAKFTAHDAYNVRHTNTAEWANNVRHHQRHSSSAESEGTLFNPHLHPTDLGKDKPEMALTPKSPLIHRVGAGFFAVSERLLVFGGLLQLLTGIVIYTGGCRENYLNGCLAHLIKGAIFWSYGLLSFGRFLGSFAELGWAWNRPPTGEFYTVEFVESLVIFFYGATNMWMERFGANPGDPFTTKQIQHIGIAVMFCFAGLVGMGIESKKMRKWLAASTFAPLSAPDMPQEAVAEPPSYSASFNPFPPLVIGITGAAMAAHAQTYLFQVQIHALWGNLLVGSSVLRCLTYFFLWLSPPRSILPSRPPTEALSSFFLACGGLVFMLSTEEVTIAAMRRGRDDVMMFLNVAVAITCFAFCWTLFIVGFKGWLKSRSHPAVGYRSSA